MQQKHVRCLYTFFNSTGGEEELLDWHKVGRCGLEMFAVTRWEQKTERHMEGEGKRERRWRGGG